MWFGRLMQCFYGDKRPPHAPCCYFAVYQRMRRITETLSFSDGTKAEDRLRTIRLQRASRVMKSPGDKQWTGADHVYSVKAVKSQNTVQVRPGHVCVSVSVRVFIACACRPEGWRRVTEWDWRASKFLHFYGESCQLFTFHGLCGPAH